nr:T9SS type A sorting domain-containing protein [Salinibacter ruber]
MAFIAAPATAQPSFTNAVLPNGVPEGASGTDVVESSPKFFDPASGDYRPDKPAGSPLVDLAGSDTPFGGRLLNGQTKTESGWDAGALESNGSALPVDLTGLEATLSEGPGGRSAVRLTWRTISETRNAGFRVQRQAGGSSLAGGEAGSPEGTADPEWTTLGYVEGAGTTSRERDYRFVDEDPPFTAGRLRYRLVQEDIGGGTETSDPVVLERPAPRKAQLRPPSPNPARTKATVELALPGSRSAAGAQAGSAQAGSAQAGSAQTADTEVGNARLAVFDMLGRQVASRTLEIEGGYRQAVRFDVSTWPSGLYFVRLTAGPTTQTERLTVVR